MIKFETTILAVIATGLLATSATIIACKGAYNIGKIVGRFEKRKIEYKSYN